MSQEMESKLFFELGQMIKIYAPTIPDINEKIYLIDYLDDNIIKLINDTDFSKLDLTIKDGKLTNESIEKISIIFTPKVKGYARQHNLIPTNWISIEFGGDIPTFINGQITDLDEDQIELTTFETQRKIYIDFNYQGIPLDLPIVNIRPFHPPSSKDDDDDELASLEKDEIESDDEDLELIIDSDEINRNVQDLFIDVDDIEVSDESLGEIVEKVRVEEKYKRYGIENQTQDILDEMLAEYPSNKRTRKVLNNIHVLIERFKQLRRSFSHFSDSGNAEKIKIKGANHKPLIEKLKKLNQKIYWLLPVVRNMHKIIDTDDVRDDNDDIDPIEFKWDTNNLMEVFRQYYDNNIPDGQNKYNYLNKSINPYFTPFTDTNDKENVIIQKNIEENLDMLIDNFDNIFSSIFGVNRDRLFSCLPCDKQPKCQGEIRGEQYVINRYNLGLKKLHNPDIKNKYSKAVITPLTNNDTVDLLGYVTLPFPYIRYSHINLPKTSIYDKANLQHFNYFYFNILPNTIMNSKTIKEGEESNDMTDAEKLFFTFEKKDLQSKDTRKEYKKIMKQMGFKYSHYFNFEQNRQLIDRQALGDNEEIYEKFLDVMIPKTKILFEIIKKNIKNGTSYSKILEHLEPFLIYDDDITFKQYEAITDFIFEKIKEHKTQLLKNNSDFLKFIRENKSYFISSILPKLIKKDDLLQDIFDKQHYSIDDSISTDTSLRKMINTDAGRVYNLALSISELTFSQPIDIEDKVDTEIGLIEQKLEEGEPLSQKECGKKYTLVKKYLDIDDLTADNNSPVFVDKKYDETPYDIGEEWKRNNSVLIASSDDDKLVIEELSQFLIENNGVEPKKARVDASAMILGSREVQEGDYATLDIGGDIKYYVRQDNTWKYDKTLSGKHIDEVNFCNLKDNCLKIKDTCTNLDSSKEKIKKNILGEIAQRFEDELQLSIDDLKSNLLKELKYRKYNLVSLKALKIRKLLKRDLFQMKIANTLEERELAVSPYESLRDAILSQVDIVKKFNDIDTFIDQYCREATDDEEGYWYYCIDSDVKLLPTFFQELATGFFEEKYLMTLEKIYKERGEKSGDGDKWVDKYSGYYISETGWDYSEGYDKSGYKIKSREVMTENKAEKLKQSKVKDTKKEYATALAKRIEAILITFDEKLYISTKSQYNFIIKTVMESINLHAPDESNYRELYAIAIKKGKTKTKTYEKKYDEIEFYSIISAYIIAVQSAIPGIIAKKAYGDCKKSFSGFPLDGNSDLTFMEYFSCMVFNLRRDDRPWDVIPKALTKSKRRKKNYEDVKDKFISTLKKFMGEKILPLDDVSQMLTLKREWLKTNKSAEIIPTEFNVQQWKTFLPPLNPVTVTRLNNIAHTFEKTLRTRMEEGSYEQFGHLWSLYGKIVSYSFSIIEAVQRAINKEPLLLETKGGIPYLENACCNTGEWKTGIYFSQKEASIQRHNNIIKSLTELYYKYKNINKSSFFLFTNDTKLKYTPIPDDFTKETIYLAFIKYCKFNSGVTLSKDLNRVCINNSCNFKAIEPIHEKIAAMEADSLNYSKESLRVLLNIINRRNILEYDLDPPVTTEKLFLEHSIEKLEEKDGIIICHPKLIEYLKKIVDRFDVSIQGEDDPIVLQFTSYLKEINRQMSVKISEKMIERGELTPALKDLLIEYSQEGSVGEKKSKEKKEKFILNWDLKGDNVYLTQEDETGFTIFTMLKELTIKMCKVFPTMILCNRTKRYVPQHWLQGSKKLSKKHKVDILSFMEKDTKMSRDTADLLSFHNNENIKAVLKYVLNHNKDLLLLLDAIPFYAGILRDRMETGSIFDGEILKQLGYYFMLCSFSLYISAFESGELRIDIDEQEQEDVSVIIGERAQLEKDTCSLLYVYLQNIKNYKDLLNISAETINNRVLKTKTKEKEQLVKRIGNLTPDEREIENLMKNNSLGEWSVGKTSAIFEYDNKQYDKERERLERDAMLEKRAGGLDDVSEFVGEIYNISDVIDVLEQDDVARRIEAEVYNLNGLAEDDDYGDRDGDADGDYF